MSDSGALSKTGATAGQRLTARTFFVYQLLVPPLPRDPARARAAADCKMRPKPRRDFRPTDQERANNLAAAAPDYHRERPT